MKRSAPVSAVAGVALALSLWSGAPAYGADTGSITGILTSPDGRLLTGDETYTVALLTSNTSQRYAVHAKSDGSYRLDGIEPGEYWVKFTYSGSGQYLDKYWGDAYFLDTAAVPSINVTAGNVVQVDEELDEPSWISGRIVGVSGPVDVPRATFNRVTRGYPANNEPTPSVAADGSYTIGPLAPGTVDVYFSGSSRWVGEDHTGAYSTSIPPEEHLQIGVGERVTIDPVLDHAGRVEVSVSIREGDGTLSAYTGTPQAWRAPAQSGVPPARMSVVSPGVFETWTQPNPAWGPVRVLLPQDPHQYLVGSWWDGGPDYASSEPLSAAPNAVRQVATTVVRGGVIAGRVGFSNGNGEEPTFGSPSMQVYAYVYRHTDDGTLEPLASVGEGWNVFPLGQGLWDTGSGTFRTPVLPPGTYTLLFTPHDASFGDEYFDDARYFAERTDVVVTAEETVTLRDVVLEPRSFDVGRVHGADRFGTAVAVSQSLFEAGAAPIVYLANARNFPDALAAGPSAIAEGGLVLTTEQHTLPGVVARELERLRPSRIIIVGGPDAVSDQVMRELRGYVASPNDVIRVGGANRYETAAKLASMPFPSGATSLFVATGSNYPDALAAGAAAGYLSSPMLLVHGSADRLDEPALASIDELGVERVYVIGGPNAVSQAIFDQLALELGPQNVRRLAGDDRYATAAAVNSGIFTHGSEYAILASGAGFADALAGAPLAGALGAPMYLSRPDCLPIASAQGIWQAKTLGIALVGGPAALGPDVENLVLCR